MSNPKQKKQAHNNICIEVTPTNPKEPPFIAKGKGRNSVSQKLFGVRAKKAIEAGFAKSITAAHGIKEEA